MATLAPGLARKVKKILDMKTDSSDLLSSISTLSSFYDENTLAARRALRTTIEERGLEINQQFLTAADVVLQALDGMQATLDNLSDSCTVISTRLAATKAAAAPLLAETDALLKEQEAVERRSALVKQFLEQYQLAPQEAEVLQSEEVGPAFFAALERVRAIHENCKVLLRTHHQRAGLELMDLMSMYQESAYERLCRWVQGECRGIGDFDAPEVAPMLHTAVVALRERPVLYKYCAEEVATARHNALFQRFVTALTRGGPGGLPRPIEMHAHDPKRYSNDMLAWVHQALASEHEFVVALFGDDKENAVHYDGDDLQAPALLDRIFESICRPLKVRIEQQLMPSPPLLLCFQLEHLLAFYHSLVVDILGDTAQLSQALRSCWGMARRVFFEQLRGRGDKLLRTPPTLSQDLVPPQQVSETLHVLVELMDAHEMALQGASDSEQATEEFSQVLDAVLEPLIEACEQSAEALRHDAPSRVDENAQLDPSRYHTYMINCQCAMQSALNLRPYAQARLERLADMVEAHVAALVAGEVNGLLAKCGLAEVVDRLQLYRGDDMGGRLGEVVAADPALALPLVVDAMRSFFACVSAPDALPEFPLLIVPRVRADAAARVGRALAEAYELVYSTIEDPTSGYLEQGGAASVKHTPSQVRTILGVL